MEAIVRSKFHARVQGQNTVMSIEIIYIFKNNILSMIHPWFISMVGFFFLVYELW